MATADQAAAGPRYAPDDPTLPLPWKGLIDGSVHYYWNPDTNLTQYEKPSSSAPIQPSPASAPTAGLTSGSNTQPGQVGEQVQTQTDQVPQTNSSYQIPQQMAHVAQQNNSVSAQPGQQQGPLTTQQQPGQQQYMQQPYQQYPQQQPVPHQQFRGLQMLFYQGPQMGQHQGHDITHHQRLDMGYQPNNYPQRPQNPQAQQFPHPQEQKTETDSKQGKKVGISPTQSQYSGVPPYQNHPQGANSNLMQQQMIGQHGQAQSYNSSPLKMQQPATMAHLPQNRNDLVSHQQGPIFQNQFYPGMVRGQQPHASPVNSNIHYDENLHRRAGNKHYFSATNNGPRMPPQQHPKHATIPMAKNPQYTRFSGAPVQNVLPGFASGLNSAPAGLNISKTDMYRWKHEVTVTGGDVPAPFMTFDATGFPPELLREMQLAGFASPTPIQAQTWPIALQNRNIVAIAKPGSGKTLGYLVPAFMRFEHRRNNPRNGPTVLVLSPTRELATQIQLEANKFGQSFRVSCTCLYGGDSKAIQLRELEQGANIVVATPGYLNDILESKQIDLRQVSLLVLDEADRMLAMGFEPQIRKVVNEIRLPQILMYTSTWSNEVIKIAKDLLLNPVQVNIGNVDELAANKSITQAAIAARSEVVHELKEAPPAPKVPEPKVVRKKNQLLTTNAIVKPQAKKAKTDILCSIQPLNALKTPHIDTKKPSHTVEKHSGLGDQPNAANNIGLVAYSDESDDD